MYNNLYTKHAHKKKGKSAMKKQLYENQVNEIAKIEANEIAPETLANQQALMAKFIAYIDATPNTVKTYTRGLKRWFKYLLSNNITKPDRQDVLNYKNALLDEGLKPNTVRNYLASLKLFTNWMATEGLYPDIAAHVKGQKVGNNHKKDPLTAGQARKVLMTLEASYSSTATRDYAIIALLLTTGLRTIEVSRAIIDDLRTEQDEHVLYIQGKGHAEKDTFIKLTPPVKMAIDAYLTTREDTDPQAPLFTSTARNGSAGNTLSTRTISKIAKTAMQHAGYDSDRLTAHSLRHTAATLNMLNGGTLEETRQLLRHTNINTTLIYQHELERLKSKSEERITNALF